MTDLSPYTLINPLNGHLAFKLFHFEGNGAFDHVQRNNYYSLVWLTHGSGTLRADFSDYRFGDNTLFAFSPYQPFLFLTGQSLKGVAIQFHPDFFCIHMHQKEVACNGILFNNIYDPPFTRTDPTSSNTFSTLIGQMTAEMQQVKLAQYDLLIAYLKIFLITASRLKADQHHSSPQNEVAGTEPFIIQQLKEAIEKDFRIKHSAADYADVLHLSVKALARITKTHFNKTLTQLISERIVIEAKRELFLTNKPVKEIAYELGYEDEYYFSRFFKTNADISPRTYRDTVGSGKGIATPSEVG